jgi:hypothetical protein
MLCSLTGFLLHVTIIHELSHVIMYTFASQPTPVKYRGDRNVLPLGRGIDRDGNNVPRGEGSDSMEVVMTGGNVGLAVLTGHNFVDPDAICVVLSMPGGQGWRVLWRKCTFHIYSTY